MQMIEISKLNPHPRNHEFFDDITGDKWEDFKKSIVRRGVVEGIVVTQDLTIVSGHQRVRACKEIGILEVPCRITHYPDFDQNTETPKEDMIIEDLISTNILQRGIGNINPMKMSRCISELERIYGIRQGSAGGNGSNQYNTKELDGNNFVEAKTQANLAEQLGIDQRQLQNYKKLNDLIPELQEMVELGSLKATTAYKIYAKLQPDEQKALFDEIGKDKIQKMTQKETERLIEEKNALQTAYNDLVKKKHEVEQKVFQLETELNNRPTIEIEKKVIPQDYEQIKKKLDDNSKYYNNLKSDYDKKINELSDLKQQIKALQSVTEEEKYSKKLKDSAIFFCGRVDDFIEKTGGFVWLSEHINELPEYERKSYIKAIEMVENWAFAMKSNMKNYL